jgi:DNA-binding transcriptional MocR family regulator
MGSVKFKRGSNTPHVRLDHWFYDSASWQALKPAPRAFYIELKRHFNGNNNGQIFLSQRDAAKNMNVGRDTIASYYTTLIEHGFITQTRGHCLGPSGVGQSASYALTELPLDGKSATKDFMQWKKQKPRRKIQHSLAGKSNHPCRKIQHSTIQMSENPTAFDLKQGSTVSENPAIYTSNHIPKPKALGQAAVSWIANGQGLCGKATRVAA